MVVGVLEDVAGAVPQRDGLDIDHGQAVEEVFAEGPLGHHLGEVAPGGGQDADIDGNGGRPADPVDLALLQDPQELDLHVEGHVADLVQEDGAPVGLLEFSRLAAPLRAGEGPALVAEELRLQEVLRDGAAVDGDKGLVLSAAGQVDGLGHDLLAGAGLSRDQDRKITARRPQPHVFYTDHLGILAQHVLEAALGKDIVLVALLVVVQLGLLVFAGDLLRPVGKLHLGGGAQQVPVVVVDTEAQGRDPDLLGLLQTGPLAQVIAHIRLEIDILPAVDQALFHDVIHGGRRDRLLDRMPDDLRPVLGKIGGILLVDILHDPLVIDHDKPVIRILKQAFQNPAAEMILHKSPLHSGMTAAQAQGPCGQYQYNILPAGKQGNGPGC